MIFSHYPQPIDGLPEPDLPLADIIIVTHHHQDHVKTATIDRLSKQDTMIFAPVKCSNLIKCPFKIVSPS